MNVEQLKVFVYVVKHGGFHSAAKALHRSQPAITNSIKNLEKQLSLELFDRSQYNISLTEHGRALFKRAEALVNQINELENYAKELNNSLEPSLRVAVDTAFNFEKYLPLFNEFINEFPDTEFEFYLEALGEASERLANNEADIAITDISCAQSDMEIESLEKIPLLAVATPEFIKKHKKHLIDKHKLKYCTQIIIKDKSQQHLALGVQPQARHCIVSDIHSKKALILANIGWGRLPKYCIENEIKKGKLKILCESFFNCRDLELCIMKNRQQSLGPIGNKIWQNLIDLNTGGTHGNAN